MFTHPSKSTPVRAFVVATIMLAWPVWAAAQTPAAPVLTAVVASAGNTAGPTDPPSAKAEKPATDAAQVKPAPIQPAKAPAAKVPPSKLSRWLEFQTGTLAARYRYIETSAGVVTANQGQYSGQVKGRFKFDPKGRVSVTAMFATGSAFTSSWNNTGIGTGDATRMWPLKQLFVAAVPFTGVEASFGSIGFVRGESTEITTYDNDGYMAGERLSVKRPKNLYFDEISFTSAVVGHLATPALWDRWDSLTEQRNYFQYFVSKKVTKSVAASVDYTRASGVDNYHAAVSAKTPKARVIDSVRYEQYVRKGPKPDSGFGVFGDKNITKRLNIGVGFANIDVNYGSLNGDRYGRGKRVYETMSFKVTPEFSFQMFMGQAVSNDFKVANNLRIDIIGSYNVLGALQRHGMLK